MPHCGFVEGGEAQAKIPFAAGVASSTSVPGPEGRNRECSGNEEDRTDAEIAAHSTLVEVGEALTGRSKRRIENSLD